MDFIQNQIFFFFNFFKFWWKIGNRLNRKWNQISKFSDFYFSSYGHFSVIFVKKITPIFDDNSKNKIGDFFNWFYFSTQRTSHLS